MSGPVTAADAIPEAKSAAAEPAVLEVTESRASHLGAFTVRERCHAEPAAPSSCSQVRPSEPTSESAAAHLPEPAVAPPEQANI